MEVSALQVMKYLLLDMYYFKQRKHQWRIKNKEAYQLAIEKFNQCNKPPQVMDQSLNDISFTVFDLETTGFYPRIGDEIVSIGATKINMNHMQFSEHFYEVVQPIKKVPQEVLTLTGLTYENVENGNSFPAAFANFVEFSQETVLVALPASFDVPFIQELAKRWGFPKFTPCYIDAYEIAQFLYPREKNSLDTLVQKFNIEGKDRHHALNDADMTAELFVHLLNGLMENGFTTFGEWIKQKNNPKVLFTQ